MTERHDVVTRWFAALQAQDLETLLALADPGIVLRPFRWVPRSEYRGHDGVRSWLADLAASSHSVELRVEWVQTARDGSLVAEGTLEADGTDFTAHFTLRDGRITAVTGYLSDRDLLDRLGVVPGGGA